MIKIYRKKTTIKAEQFDGSRKMIAKYAINNISKVTSAVDDHGEYYKEYFINAVELKAGDWIATGVKGEHWAITDDVFQQTYAGLPIIPQVIADYIEKCKCQYRSLASALMEIGMPADVQDYFRNYQSTEQWIWLQDNFARAWLDGYQVEEEK